MSTRTMGVRKIAGDSSYSIVTPAKAGAHHEISRWIPAFAGMTTDDDGRSATFTTEAESELP